MAEYYKIRVDCSYSTTNRCNTAETNVTNTLAAVSYVPVAGRFAAGINRPSNTRLTVSVDVDTEDDAKTLLGEISRAVNVPYTSGMTSIHKAYD